MSTPCPFCEGTVSGRICESCGRDRTVPRRICKACGKMSPKAEAECCHCGAKFRSEMRWKIPLIIAIFVFAFILAIFIQLIGR